MVHTTFERLPEEKKNRILQASRAEFIRYPYGKTSINRILAEAEMRQRSRKAASISILTIKQICSACVPALCIKS